jgi:hypothetical protein
LKKKIPQIVKKIQQTKLPEVNYSYQKALSYSQYSIYQGCPHRWALRYKDGYYDDQPSIHTLFGTAIHETLQHYLTVFYEKSGAEADRIEIGDFFQERLIGEYKKQYKSNNNNHFSSSEELREFFDDGIEIINFLKNKKGKFFSKKGWWLVGCEVPILLPLVNNLYFKGYIDLVLYNEKINKFYLYDIKTSTWGWGEKTKKDELKQFQLILYKKFFSEQYGVPEDQIEVEFFITRRKLYENTEFPISRIQEFKPPAGKIKLNKASKSFNEFIKNSYNKEGSPIEKVYHKNVSPNCKWCPFNERKDLCSKSNS